MADIKQWEGLGSATLANNLLKVVGGDLLLLLQTPCISDGIWQRACRSLGTSFKSKRNWIIYYSAFYSKPTGVAKEFFKLFKIRHPSLTYLIPEIELADSNQLNCVCGLPISGYNFYSAINECSNCHESFHDACLGEKPQKESTVSWVCPLCKSIPAKEIVPFILRKPFLDRRQIRILKDQTPASNSADEIPLPINSQIDQKLSKPNTSLQEFQELESISLKSARITCDECKAQKTDLYCTHKVRSNYADILRAREIFKNPRYGNHTIQDITPNLRDPTIRKRMPGHLQPDFDIATATGDGNCFFNAVSVSLTGIDNHSLADFLRRSAFYEYLTKKYYYDDKLHRFLGAKNEDRLLRVLQKPGTYTGIPETFVLANAIGIRIEILERIQDTPYFQTYFFSPEPEENFDKTIKLFLDERHYSCVLPINPDIKANIATEKCPDIQGMENCLCCNSNYESDSDIECLDDLPPKSSNIQTTSSVKKENYNEPTHDIPFDVEPNQNRTPPHTDEKPFEGKSCEEGKPTKQIAELFKRVLLNVQNEVSQKLKEGKREKEILACISFLNGDDNAKLNDVVKKCILKKSTIKYIHIRCLRIKRFAKKLEAKQNILQTLIIAGASLSLQKMYARKVGLDFSKIPIKRSLNEEPKDGTSSLECESESSSADEMEGVSKELCKIFKITPAELQFEPKKEFTITITRQTLLKTFNFESLSWIPNAWGTGINTSFTEKGFPCSFSSRSDPRVLKKENNEFCNMRGYCKCGMKYRIIVNDVPKVNSNLEAVVISSGVFCLRQTKSTSRNISNYEREKVAKMLENVKSHALFLENRHHLTGLRALHRNEPQRSSAVLRKIKSESKQKTKSTLSLGDELGSLQTTMQKTINEREKLPGFIQFCSGGKNVYVHLYEYLALYFHSKRLKEGFVTCHIDATGDLFKNPVDKQVLTYHLIGKNEKNITWPIGQILSQSGSQVDISFFLGNIYRDLRKVSHSLKTPLSNLVVCDFSYALIHGISLGINREDITVYMERSYEFMKGNCNWNENKTLIYICASHLEHACKINLMRKPEFKPSRKKRNLLSLALNALGRLQECFDLEEFEEVCNSILTLFLSPDLEKKAQDLHISILEAKKPQASIYADVKEPDGNVFSIAFAREKNLFLTLKEKSPFSKEFAKLRTHFEKSSAKSRSKPSNEYFCPTVVNYFEKYKIPMYPFWSAAVVRKAKGKPFVRETNAVIESRFNVYKKVLQFSKENSFVDYARRSYTYHDGELKTALLALGESPRKPSSKQKSKKKDIGNLFDEEKWKRGRKSRKRTQGSRYLSQLNEVENLTSSLPGSPPSKKKKENGTSPNNKKDSSPPPKEKEGNTENPAGADNVNKTDISDITDETILFRIGEFNKLDRIELARMAFDTQWLNDRHVDKFISYLLQTYKKDFIHFPGSVMLYLHGNEWDGPLAPKENLQEMLFANKAFERPSNVKYLLHPVRWVNHWFLVLMDVENKICRVYDSMDIDFEMFWEERMRLIQNVVVQRFCEYLEIPSTGWKTVMCECPKQPDSISCGIILLQVVEEVIKAPHNPEIPKKINVVEGRRDILTRMLLTTETGEKILDICKGNWREVQKILSPGGQLQETDFDVTKIKGSPVKKEGLGVETVTK